MRLHMVSVFEQILGSRPVIVSTVERAQERLRTDFFDVFFVDADIEIDLALSPLRRDYPDLFIAVFWSSSRESPAHLLKQGADFLLPQAIDIRNQEKTRIMLEDVVYKEKVSPRFRSSDGPEAKWLLPNAVVIGSSTGGPEALEKLFRSLKAPLRFPVFLCQHMPEGFTLPLAKRLAAVSGIDVREAQHGDVVTSCAVYIAPGDYHMCVTGGVKSVTIRLNQGPSRNSVRPSVDTLFESASQIYGSSLLGIVLTGMGQDGLLGAIAIREAGGRIVIQDKASCVVFGMPGAIYDIQQYDAMLQIERIADVLNAL